MADDRTDYRRLIFALGSLPFWTGRNKFRKFLLGEMGSFWEGESPLKPIYLNHFFFASFAATGNNQLIQKLQHLINSGYVERSQLTPKKPHMVLKLTDKGVKQYYNQIVTRRKVKQPVWWLHHISQLKTPPKSPITTAGELIEFSGRLYITQTPKFLELKDRVQDSSTKEIIGGLEANSEQLICLKAVQVETKQGVTLRADKNTEKEMIDPGELRGKLTHFPAPQRDADLPDPYSLKGRLIDFKEQNERLYLLFENNQKQQIILSCDPRFKDSVELIEDNYYVFGPLEPKIVRRGQNNSTPVVKLGRNGLIKPASEFV